MTVTAPSRIIGGHLQSYPWGMLDGLSAWLPPGRAAGQPQAELWFGAHPHGRSPLVPGPGHLDQADLLVKLLAAGRPLSIQVHPDEATAAAPGPELFTADGASILVDHRGKEEILIALTPVRALAGLCPAPRMAVLLDPVLPASATGVRAAAAAGDPGAVLAGLFDLPASTVTDAISRLPLGWQAAGLPVAHIEDLSAIRGASPDDPGVLVASLLEHHILRPWQAIHIVPGVLHAYLAGVGVEVMTPSDNVVRLGLTSKPIHPAAGITLTRPIGAVVTDPTLIGPVRWRHTPAGAHFTVDSIRGRVPLPAAEGYRIAVCVEGTLGDEASGSSATAGEAIVLAATATALTAAGVAVVADVTAGAPPIGGALAGGAETWQTPG